MNECTSFEVWLIYFYPKGYYLPKEYVKEFEELTRKDT